MEFWNSIGVSVCVCFLSFLLGVTLALCGMSVGVRVEVGAVSMFFFFFSLLFLVKSDEVHQGKRSGSFARWWWWRRGRRVIKTSKTETLVEDTQVVVRCSKVKVPV